MRRTLATLEALVLGGAPEPMLGESPAPVADAREPRQQDSRPHLGLALDQYLMFPDEFSEDTWTLLYLRFGAGKGVPEIADIVDRSESSVYRSLALAKERKELLLRARRRELLPPRENT
ncbi:MAG: hypothetical protein AB7N70_35140 [Dehalococcoidia bacterium]